MKKRAEFAEEIAYWDTNQSSADDKLDEAKVYVTGFGGQVLRSGFGDENGKAGFMLAFVLDGRQYEIYWPVLKTRGTTARAAKLARVQAATALFHHVKALVLASVFLGTYQAFLPYMLMPDGQTRATDYLAGAVNREAARLLSAGS